MMQGWTLVAALVSVFAGSAVHAAEQGAPALSLDGARGYADIELTRVALFDGRIAEAKRSLAEAVAAFERAKDEAGVMAPAEAAPMPSSSAKADARSPAQVEADAAAMNRAKQANSAKVWAGGAPDDRAAAAANAAAEERAAAAAHAAKQAVSAKAYAAAAMVRWVAIGGEPGLAAALDADPAKAAAVADADARLAAGDRAGALAALKRGGARGEVSIALLPLDQTLAALHRAATMIDGGKPYEASALLLRIMGTTRLASLDGGDLAAPPPSR